MTAAVTGVMEDLLSTCMIWIPPTEFSVLDAYKYVSFDTPNLLQFGNDYKSFGLPKPICYISLFKYNKFSRLTAAMPASAPAPCREQAVCCC